MTYTLEDLKNNDFADIETIENDDRHWVNNVLFQHDSTPPHYLALF